MRKSIKRNLILLLLSLLALVVFPACAVGEKSLNTFIDENDLTAVVTYYSNEGRFNGTRNLTKKDIYCKPNQTVFEIPEKDNKTYVSRTGYVFLGWFYAELDDSGNPIVLDEQFNVVKATDRPFDFDNYKATNGDHIYLCAKWEKDVVLEYYLVSDIPITVTVTEDEQEVTKTYNSGDKIKEESFNGKSSITVSDKSPVDASNATFLQLFTDEECTIKATGTVNKPTDKVAPKLYAKYIEGKWEVVKNSSDVLNMFNTLAGTSQFYVYADAPIDCSSLSQIQVKDFTNVKIEGNGATITNLKFVKEQISNTQSFAIFGKINASASIKNLTFENLKVTFGIKSMPGTMNVSLFAIAKTVTPGAVLENLSFNNVEMIIDTNNANVQIDNINLVGDAYETDNYLFGGVGVATDQDFFNQYPTVTVTNSTLKVDPIQE